MCKEVIKVNERIKELRSIVGLSQREFGERIGIVKTAVSKIEKGRILLVSKQYYQYVENLMSIMLGLKKD